MIRSTVISHNLWDPAHQPPTGSFDTPEGTVPADFVDTGGTSTTGRLNTAGCSD
jgi:hypothetical protein